MIEVLVLLGSFTALCMIGMPVAYTLGLAAILGALWIDVPLEAVMIQISSGVNSFSLLAIPFFVLAGAIMAEGGMAVFSSHNWRCSNCVSRESFFSSALSSADRPSQVRFEKMNISGIIRWPVRLYTLLTR